MKPVIAWPGGKRLLAKRIIPLLPEHVCYCEPFGGGAAVLLAKPRSKVEVYNDLNGDLVNLFRVVQFHPVELKRTLRFVLNSRVEFNDIVLQPGVTDIQKAARWFVKNRLAFGGKTAKGASYGYGRKSGGAASGSRAARIRALMDLNRRLDRVNVENLPWQDCIERYDSEETCFYLDPPYVGGDQRVYGDLGFDDVDHEALREMLGCVDGKWVLSYDDHPMIRDLYGDCHIVEVSRKRGIGNNHKTLRKRFDELIIRPGGQA